MRPCRSTTASTSRCQDASSLTSTCSCPIGRSPASHSGSTTSAATTTAPSAARCRLSSAPMPRAPPVTTTTVPGSTPAWSTYPPVLDYVDCRGPPARAEGQERPPVHLEAPPPLHTVHVWAVIRATGLQWWPTTVEVP